jgi:hypothetical protein
MAPFRIMRHSIPPAEEVLGKTASRHTYAEFVVFLQELFARVEPGGGSVPLELPKYHQANPMSCDFSTVKLHEESVRLVR